MGTVLCGVVVLGVEHHVLCFVLFEYPAFGGVVAVWGECLFGGVVVAVGVGA